MFKLVTVFFAIFLSFGSLAHSEPKFSEFFVQRIFMSGPVPPINWDEDVFPSMLMFRYSPPNGDVNLTEEYIQNEWREKAFDANHRFAGHYVIMLTGCGAGLQCGVVVDILSGEVVTSLPLAEAGYEWNFVSRLLIVNPYEEGLDYVQNRVTEFWTFKDGSFLHMEDQDIPWSIYEVEPERSIVHGRSVPIPSSRPTPTQLAKEKLIRKLSR